MTLSIKNYTTKVPVNRSIQLIQEILQKNGASAVMINYEQGTGRIESLSFKITLGKNDIAFRLPINWKKFQEILKKDNIKRWNDEEHVQRVAWKNMHDWIEMQMVMYKLNQVEMMEIFLPYAITNSGDTFFQHIQKNPKLLLGESSR